MLMTNLETDYFSSQNLGS